MVRLYLSNIFAGRGVLGKVLVFVLLFGLPVISVVYSIVGGMNLDDAALSIIISSFSIFSAMLFASQVAAFSVFNYKAIDILSRKPSVDDIADAVESALAGEYLESLRQAFRRINGGISLLTMVAVFVVINSMFLISDLVSDFSHFLFPTLSFLLTHFILMFLYLCYQVFAFFDAGYTGTERPS